MKLISQGIHMKKLIILINILFAVNLSAQSAGSSGITDVRSAGLGNTYTSSSGGVFAIGKNPANLLNTKSNFQLSTFLPLPNISFTGGTDFLSAENISYYFEPTDSIDSDGEKVGKKLTPSDIEDFKDLFKEGNSMNANSQITLLAFSANLGREIGVLGFSINDRISMNSSIPKNIIELIDGNQTGYVYDLNDLKLDSWYVRDISLSFAKNLKFMRTSLISNFNVGASLKFVQGFAYSRMENPDISFNVDENYNMQFQNKMMVYSAFSPDFGVEYDYENEEKESNPSLFPTPAGTGLGLDLGINFRINKIWQIGIAVTDIGSITWDNEATVHTADSKFTVTDLSDGDVLDSLFNTLEPEGEAAREFKSDLPTAFRLGVGVRIDKLLSRNFPGEMLFVFDYNQGFNNVPSNSTDPRFSTGLEWIPSGWFTLRNGLSIGGIDGFRWSLGIGFDTGLLDIDLSATHFNSHVAPNSAKRVGMAIGTRWKF